MRLLKTPTATALSAGRCVKNAPVPPLCAHTGAPYPVNRPPLLVLVLAVLLVLTLVPGALAHGARCPVCGMSVDTHDAKWVTTWNGDTYYFCMEADQKAFLSLIHISL